MEPVLEELAEIFPNLNPWYPMGVVLDWLDWVFCITPEKYVDGTDQSNTYVVGIYDLVGWEIGEPLEMEEVAAGKLVEYIDWLTEIAAVNP